MPSYKPRITVYTDEDTSMKIAYIAKKENRSASNLTEYLIKKAIDEYEKENGEIIIENIKKEDGTYMKIIKAVTGVTTGQILGDITVEAIKKHRESKN